MLGSYRKLRLYCLELFQKLLQSGPPIVSGPSCIACRVVLPQYFDHHFRTLGIVVLEISFYESKSSIATIILVSSF